MNVRLTSLEQVTATLPLAECRRACTHSSVVGPPTITPPACHRPLLQERAAYHEAYGRLKEVKAEIDGVQAALERARVRLQRDFQAWFSAMAGKAGDSAAAAPRVPMGPAPLAQQAGAQQPPQEQARPASAGTGPAVVRPGGGAGSRSGSSAVGSVVPQGSISPAHAPGQAQHPWSPGPRPGTSQQAQQLKQPHLQAPDAAAQPQATGQPAGQTADPSVGVDADVLAAAKPLLTGNPQADGDIIRFYQARAALLKGMR